MGRLLLRSTKSETCGTRIDVLFQNVRAMHLPRLVGGLVVGIAEPAEREPITETTGLVPDDDTTFFTLFDSMRGGYVVAGVVVECEDEGEYFEPSTLWPGPDGIAR